MHVQQPLTCATTAKQVLFACMHARDIVFDPWPGTHQHVYVRDRGRRKESIAGTRPEVTLAPVDPLI
jgi:hypothetical protein